MKTEPECRKISLEEDEYSHELKLTDEERKFYYKAFETPITTKWRKIEVEGSPVSKELAKEIILRTSHWDFELCNGPHIDELIQLFEIPESPRPTETDFLFTLRQLEHKKELRKAIQSLDLQYLASEQIATSWSNGTHGWLQWDGTVGNAQTYALGKYPANTDLYMEWLSIARAFPQLTLTCLVDDDYHPVKFKVERGTVSFNPTDEHVQKNLPPDPSTVCCRCLRSKNSMLS